MSTTLGAPSPISDHLAHATDAHAYAPPSSSFHTPRSYQHNYHYYMNPTPPVQYTHTQAHHGTKRSAPDDEIESPANNISTHFKKLRLNQAHLPHPTTLSPVGVSLRANHNHNQNHVYNDCTDSQINTSTPPPSYHGTVYQNHKSTHHYHHQHDQHHHYEDESQIHPPTTTDFMPIDETPHKIYIHDLDSEIAAIEAAEPNERMTFLLPDFDKNVSRIPENVLRSRELDTSAGSGHGGGGRIGEPDASQALVLYRDPVSISVPPEEDVVRKAIIESRRIAREKMRREYEEQYRPHGGRGHVHHDLGFANGVTGVSHGIHGIPSHQDKVIDVDEDMNDLDAMDIE